MLIKRILNKFKKKTDPNLQIIKDWENEGKPAPPPHIIKQHVITEIQKNAKYTTFIETGTYFGDMVDAQKNNFNKVYSIELGKNLYDLATERFKQDRNVKIYLGDSSDVLVEICSTLTEPTIFWLDGHFSEGVTARGKKICPIFEELTAIFDASKLKHIILIDDARLFIGDFAYPTIESLIAFIKDKRSNVETYITNDIIHCIL